jgi:hypothetical protein
MLLLSAAALCHCCAGLKGFWLQAMKEHQDIKGYIEEWDEQVLLYVADIDVTYTHEQQVGAGVIVAPAGLLLYRGVGV